MNTTDIDTIFTRKWAVGVILDTLRHVMAVTGGPVEVDSAKVIIEATKLENYVLGTTPEAQQDSAPDTPFVSGPIQATPPVPASPLSPAS